MERMGSSISFLSHSRSPPLSREDGGSVLGPVNVPLVSILDLIFEMETWKAWGRNKLYKDMNS